METNNDSPNPIREDDWDEAAEENYPQELTEVLQAADVAEQLEQAQEEEYTPDWDGTDAEFVEDEDAAEYEEQYAGIKLSYTLNREEAMACLKRAHIYKTVGRRAWLETGILIVAAALFFVSFGLYQGGYNLALGILSLAVAAAVWLVPYLDMRKRAGEIAGGMAEHHPENDKDLHEILAPLEKLFPCDLSYTAEELHKLTPDTLSDAVYDCAMKAYAAREEAFGLQPDGTPLMRELERVVMLRVVDEYWMDHLEAMDDLRQGIGLRAYGNVKPVDEYKRAGFDMFDEMVNGIQSETVRRLFTVRVRREQKLERKTVARSAATNAGGDDSEKKRPVRRVKKPGRNDPCPCGKLRPNGLPMKYKDCCGKNA